MSSQAKRMGRLWTAASIGGLLLLCVAPIGAQITSNNPSQILQQYRNFRTSWMTNIWPYANTLFALLATIEFAWSAAVMALEKTDLQSWTSALIRKIMWLGAFYALLLFGRQWIPAIIDSFSQLGGTAAGINGDQGLSPSDVFTQGLNIAGALMDAASSSAFFKNPGSCIAVIISAAFVVLAFIAVTIQYIVAVVESYLVVSAGVIFLGFGGSRWTTPYVERYIGLGVSTGVKIMILYMLIGVGLSLSGGWLSEAAGIGTSPNPSMTGFDVMGAALIFMMLCWQVPKLFAAVLGGAPALSGGDLVSTGTAVLAGGATVAAFGAGAVAAAAGGAASLADGGGAARVGVSGIGAVGSTGGGSVPPPSNPPLGPSPGSRPRQPNPPSGGSPGMRAPSMNVNVRSTGSTTSAPSPARSALSSVGGDGLIGSGFEGERPAAGFGAYSMPIESRSVGLANTVAAPPGSSGAPIDEPPTSPDASGGSETPLGSNPVADAQSVGSPTAAEAQPPTTGRGERLSSGARLTRRAFSMAVDRLRGTRHGFGGLPSDAAPHTQPPRMPIDHSD